MVTYKYTLFLLFTLSFLPLGFGQHHKFGFSDLLNENPEAVTTFCVPNDSSTIELLNKEEIRVKYSSENWLFISTTASWIDKNMRNGALSNYYFEFAPPMALADSARVKQHVVQVHNGTGGLQNPHTGEGVIIGYVDQGIDWNHPDFIDANGNTRVLRYWDHTTNVGGIIPQPYNYGIVWDSAAINSGICTSIESGTAHGTSVAGMGSGNGMANGTNMGIAPNSKIIIVESNFSLPNWTLTIADACDYIFKVADTLGLPAVVNLSLGSYLGSHDGNDPASEYMETLLDAQTGRIIVCAAGNSGAKGKYHVTGNVDADTSFVWILNNPNTSGAFGSNKIYFDLWSDISDATFNFAFGADKPAPSYGLRGRTDFIGAMSSINTPVFDTIYNSAGNRIATIETYTEIIGGNYHMEVLFSNVDSTNYLYRFMTTGSGKYDLWSGAWMGLNDLVTTIPSSSTLPAIIHYHMPDSLQTIVSSWNCSEKVISVGNFRNRLGHIDNNNNVYLPSDLTTPGKLSPNSSKGPNRHLTIKPDISASGDISLSAFPLSWLTNPSYNASLDSGGWHGRNGGTSMASPIVSGIAALYLESCNLATYADFKADLIATAYMDGFTGAVPNNAYGYGKPHALNLLLSNQYSAWISGNPGICSDSTPTTLTVNSNENLNTAFWSDGFIGNPNQVSEFGNISAIAINDKGCKAYTDTIEIVQLDLLPILPIVQSGNILATLSLTNYQWTLNGIDIPGATNQTLEIFPPYGIYTCYCVSVDGCISETPPLDLTVGLSEYSKQSVTVFPNPTNDRFVIHSSNEIKSIELFDESGKHVELVKKEGNSYSLEHLEKGIYHLVIELSNEKIYSKITRM